MARFQKGYCSQCGREFGPSNHGFSHCENHSNMYSFDFRRDYDANKDVVDLIQDDACGSEAYVKEFTVEEFRNLFNYEIELNPGETLRIYATAVKVNSEISS